MSDVVERALQLSRADGCVVVHSESTRSNLRWAGSTLTTNGTVRTRSVTVVSVVGRSVGVRSASTDDDLEALVRASEQAARDADGAEDAAPLVEGGAVDDFGLPAAPSGPDVLAGLAAGLGDAFREARGTDLRLYGFASHALTTTWLGSSTGLRRRHVQPTGSVELTGKSGAGSSWVAQHTRTWDDVSVAGLVGELRRRLGWAERSVELPAGRYDTVLPPSAVADLMVYAYWTMSARTAREGRSVFSRPGGGTRVGERLGPTGLRLWSDPHDAGLGVTPFATSTSSSEVSSVFDAGLALPATDWVSDGVLTALVQPRAGAPAGSPPAPYVHNLAMDGGGTASTDDLVAQTSRGLLLTCLWYIREVDPETLLLTGLTRDGVYLVEDGEVVGQVNNFRFNESPVDLLGRISDVGAAQPCLPREWSDGFTWARTPPLRVPDFRMSSVSPAS